MNIQKVYNAEGKCVDKFRRPTSHTDWFRGRILCMAKVIPHLNSKGFYVRKQFTANMNLKAEYQE